MDSIQAKSRFKTLVVSGLCLLGATAGGYLLYFDLNELGRSGQGKPLGKVEKRESKVRRKSSASYVWTNVQVSEDLFLKDSISTGRGSAASVRLADGSLLDIGEDSLVVMDDTTNLALNFLRGSVVVHKADGDSKISIGKDGKAKVEELFAKLIRPASLARFFVIGKSQKQMVFEWQLRTKSNVDSFTVQVSRDKLFSAQLTQNLTTDSKTQLVQTTLGTGKYYWRVLSKNKVLTETRQFNINGITALLPVFPAQQQKVSNPPDETGLQFRWINPKASAAEDVDTSQGEHRLEVSRDKDFKNIVVSELVNATTGTVKVPTIPDGLLHWRIRSAYEDSVVMSGAKAFEFKKVVRMVSASPTPGLNPSQSPSGLPANAPTNPEPAPQEPEPVEAPPPPPPVPYPTHAKPATGATYNPLAQKDPLEASWTEVENASAYEVALYQEAKGKIPRKNIYHVKTEKTHVFFRNLQPGDYTWTLRTLAKDKRMSEFMPLIHFSVSYGEVLAPPQVVSPEVQ